MRRVCSLFVGSVFLGVLAVGAWAAVGAASSRSAPMRMMAPGLSPSENRALQIASVSEAGDDRFGLVVTVKFKGDVQDLLGQGHLKNGLVALILEPKANGQTPTGLVDEGGGSFQQRFLVPASAKAATRKPFHAKWETLTFRAPESVLTNTASHDFGALRHINEITFFASGIKVSALRAVEVKSFATAPSSSRTLATAAAELGIPGWRDILNKKPTDFAQLGVDPSKLTCDQLKALRAELSSAHDQLEIQQEELAALLANTKKVLQEVQDWINNYRERGAAIYIGRIFVKAPSQAKLEEDRAKLQDDLVELGQAIAETKTEIANIDKMIDQIDELLKKCTEPTRTAMGSLSNGTGGALAYSVETNTAANAFELTLPQGNSVTGTSSPSGFSCTDSGNVEECKNGSVRPNTPVAGSFVHSGTISANCGCVQVAFSADNGATWFVKATLTGPSGDSPATVTISEDDTWTWNTDLGKAYVCVNVRTTPPQSFVSADITGPNGYRATTNGKWPLGSDGSRQLSAPATQPGDYTKTLVVYDANGNQTATVTKTFTVAPPGTDGPSTNPPCPKPTE